jgi:serine/threonine protein kinase
VELKQGALIADRFRLVRLLGKGGMGEVWLAQHASLDVPCAVKFIHGASADNAEVRQRFEREAKAAASLRSPHVVQILDYGICEGMPYLAMELLEGEALSDRIRAKLRLDGAETYRVVAQVGKALTKAHAAGIVHRDLKPENIFLVADSEGEVAKVLDFGVAKQTATLDSNTRTGALLGTPYYMSPEQAQGIKAIDHRADLWSLAVVTFRCVTGELPFKSTALGDLLIKIVTQPLPIPSQIASGLPEGFDVWWARAAEREPERRFQSARELVEGLGLALGVTQLTGLGVTPMPNQRGASAQQNMQRTVIAEPMEEPQPPRPPPARPAAGRPAQRAYATEPLPAWTPQPQQPQQQAYFPQTAPGLLPLPPFAGGSGVSAQSGLDIRLGESGHSATVGGIAGPPAPPPVQRRARGGPVAVLAGVALALGIGGFVAFRAGVFGGGTPAPAAAAPPAETTTATPPDTSEAPPPSTPDTKAPPPDAPASDAPTATTEGARPPPPVGGRPPPPTTAGSPPPPSTVQTELDVPPPKTPKPKPVPTYDPGF